MAFRPHPHSIDGTSAIIGNPQRVWIHGYDLGAMMAMANQAPTLQALMVVLVAINEIVKVKVEEMHHEMKNDLGNLQSKVTTKFYTCICRHYYLQPQRTARRLLCRNCGHCREQLQGTESLNPLLQHPTKARVGKLTSYQNDVTSKILIMEYNNLEKYGITIVALILLVPNVMSTLNKFFACICKIAKTIIIYIY